MNKEYYIVTKSPTQEMLYNVSLYTGGQFSVAVLVDATLDTAQKTCDTMNAELNNEGE